LYKKKLSSSVMLQSLILSRMFLLKIAKKYWAK